ncbi:sugar ABC transporter substrate-binding protein [uncultured Amnibacterium sp.]|uniref:sugar ABC transporter substrate-binding protein n=1 Tax=uncultured Amnibacterium sp. TaxID=1631851 RepID=UPI0035CC7340
MRVDLLTLQRLGLPADQNLGAKLAASSANVKSYNWFGPPGLNPPTEVAALQSAAAAGSNGIVVGAFPAELFQRPIDDAVSKGITVETLDVPAPASQASAHFGPSKFALGVALADDWAKVLGKGAKGYVQPGVCVPGLPVLDAVVRGFKSEMTKLEPGVTTKAALNVTGDPASNFTSWQRVTTQESDALGFFGVCDQDAPNLVKVKKSSNAKYLIGTTSGDTASTITEVKNGTLNTVVSQDGFVQGYTSMYFLLQHLISKKPIPKGWFNTGLQVITKSNADAALSRLKATDPKVSYLYYQSVIDKLLTEKPTESPADALTSSAAGPTPGQ